MALLNDSFNNRNSESDSQQRKHSQTTAILMSPMPSRSSSSFPITVVGSGDMGRALGTSLLRAGYRVLIASRNPDRTLSRLGTKCGEVVGISEGISASNVVVLAVPPTVHAGLPLQLMEGKIAIDVSNRQSSRSKTPQDNIGESLQSLLPDTRVVKAFNALSAYSLLRGLHQGGSQRVPFCGNDDNAKAVVSGIIRRLGYLPDDRGTIAQAVDLEDIPFTFFPEWRVPVAIAAAVMAFYWLILLFRFQLCPMLDLEGNWNYTKLKNMILQQSQLTFSLTAFTLLTLCYTPGVLAAYLQLYRRTKYTPFPNWLDRWLKSRKQLGLIALQIAGTHMIGAIIHVLMEHGKGDWRSDSYFTCGIFSFGLMLILGITSFPSVGATLSWQEFSFIHRYCGWWALVFACLHAIFVKWNGLTKGLFRCIVIADQVQLAMILPILTLLLKLPLLLPCLGNRLTHIRSGGD